MEKIIEKNAVEEWLNDPENFKIFTTKLMTIKYEFKPRLDKWEESLNFMGLSQRRDEIFFIKKKSWFKRVWVFLTKERKWK